MRDETVAERTRDRRAARLGNGVTITFLIAMGVRLDARLPGSGARLPPRLRASAPQSLPAVVWVLFVTFMIMQACFQVAGFARAFPLFFLMALIPALFWTFRKSLRGGSGLIVVLLLIGLMPLPMVSNSLVSGATPLLFGPSGALLPLPDDFQEFFRPVHS